MALDSRLRTTSRSVSEQQIMAVRLSFERVGRPTAGLLPILALHGVYGSSRSWQTLSKAIARRCQTEALAIDLRNHGLSEHSPLMSYELMATDVAELARQQFGPGHQVDVVGHSMGGLVGLEVAQKYPGLVRKAVILDILPANYSKRKISSIIHFGKALAKVDLSQVKSAEDALEQLKPEITDLDIREHLVRDNLAFDPPTGRAFWRANVPVINDTLTAMLQSSDTKPLSDNARCSTPVLLLAGKQSNFVTPQHLPSLHALFSNVEVVTLDAGHWIQVDRPTDVIEHITRFLS